MNVRASRAVKPAQRNLAGLFERTVDTIEGPFVDAYSGQKLFTIDESAVRKLNAVVAHDIYAAAPVPKVVEECLQSICVIAMNVRDKDRVDVACANIEAAKPDDGRASYVEQELSAIAAVRTGTTELHQCRAAGQARSIYLCRSALRSNQGDPQTVVLRETWASQCQVKTQGDESTVLLLMGCSIALRT